MKVPEPDTDRDEFITLSNFLKLHGQVDTGGEAKVRIQRGEVKVNDQVETRRGRKLVSGDRVTFNGQDMTVKIDA